MTNLALLGRRPEGAGRFPTVAIGPPQGPSVAVPGGAWSVLGVCPGACETNGSLLRLFCIRAGVVREGTLSHPARLMSLPPIPTTRLRAGNDAPVHEDRGCVLYWMIAARRTRWSFGLQHALQRAEELDKPLVVLEALRVGYRWASDRIHRFVVDGMADNARAFREHGVRYYPYLEPEEGAGKGLLEALAADACLVVTDHFPSFFLPRMVTAAGKALDVRLEVVDGNGLLPLSVAGKAYPTAFSFRRFLHKRLPEHLEAFPLADPLEAADLGPEASIEPGVLERWRPVEEEVLERGAEDVLAALPIDHDVTPIDARGGSDAAGEVLGAFLERKLSRYKEERNQPEEDVPSGLSPYLHFGHVSVHEAFARLVEREEWTIDRLADTTNGQREGWWGMSPPAEAFLDELVTWREVGYVFCDQRPDDYDRFESLPGWAQETLDEHATDPREHVYDLAEFEQARTHDELWNAAQRQLRRDGVIHNYLRMLWGKKILHWSRSPREALEILIELNNKYAIDGRNPNSYSGIFWTLGRFDRAWGPERPIFGKIRYMTSANTARKVRVKDYVQEYGERGLFA